MVKLITPFRDKTPDIHPDAFVDRSARIIGDVVIDKGANIWPMAVLRADSAEIMVGRNAAILDLALVEAPEGFPVIIEMEALISHRAVVHGAQVKRGVLVGIGSIILDGAIISSGSIIGAGSVVPPGTRIPPTPSSWVCLERLSGRQQKTRGRLSLNRLMSFIQNPVNIS